MDRQPLRQPFPECLIDVTLDATGRVAVTPEEYQRQLREDRAKEWTRLRENGRHPTWQEMLGALWVVGLDPATDVAEYVVRRFLPKGHPLRIKVPRGNQGGPRRETLDDDSLLWFYQRKLEDMQGLKHDDPKKFAKVYGCAPAAAARLEVAADQKVPKERIRRLAKKMAAK